MPTKTITLNEAERLYDVFVKHLGEPESRRDDFVYQLHWSAYFPVRWGFSLLKLGWYSYYDVRKNMVVIHKDYVTPEREEIVRVLNDELKTLTFDE